MKIKKAANGACAKFVHDVALNFSGTECLIWPFAFAKDGCALITVDGVRQRAPRYICSVVHGEPLDPKMDAAHECGNGHLGCINPNHLSWKTRKENIQDAVRHGTMQRGEKHSTAKLNDNKVREIRRLFGLFRDEEIAKSYGVSRKTISAIRFGKSWVHVKGENDV